MIHNPSVVIAATSALAFIRALRTMTPREALEYVSIAAAGVERDLALALEVPEVPREGASRSKSLPLSSLFKVRCQVVCGDETLRAGTVYARAATWLGAQVAAVKHVHETWDAADMRIDYFVKTDHPERVDDEWDRTELVFTEGA